MSLTKATARALPVMPLVLGACLPGAAGRISMRLALIVSGVCFP